MPLPPFPTPFATLGTTTCSVSPRPSCPPPPAKLPLPDPLCDPRPNHVLLAPTAKLPPPGQAAPSLASPHTRRERP